VPLTAPRRSRRRTVVATPHVVATTTGLLFSVSGALVVLVALLPAPTALPGASALRGLGLIALVVGVGTLLLRHRLPASAAHLLVLTGTALVTLAVRLAGDSPLAVALAGLYALIAVDSAFFFSWRGAWTHQALAVGACLTVLGSHGAPGLGPGLLVAGTSVLVAGVVGWLVRAAAEAETDPLTGAPNRRGLERMLDEAVATARRTGAPLSLALLDLDHFKRVNDRHGHDAGDRLLEQAAQTWQSLLEPGQVLARQGGDEFTLVLPGCSVDDAVAVVDRLREAVRAEATCSAGVAEWDPDESLSLLFASADGALYHAKREGRDCTRRHSSAVSATAALRCALDRGELVLHYQPLVHLPTGRTYGAEALVRWQHPERGLVLPGEFLPLAEASDLMVDLGRFVLEQACRQAVRWRCAGGPDLVSVNVAGRELLAPGYLAGLERVLSTTGLPAHALVLEVTETSLDADAAGALDVLRAVRALGVRVAIDDFGTGWSSLSRLSRLPVDILKIDRSFVRDLAPGADRAPLVQAIVSLATALGLGVVAEGVEHPHQADLLRSLGSAHAQGYLFSRPLPADRLPLALATPVG